MRCGPPGKPKRYYRVKGGRSDFAGDKRRRRLVAAEPLERAVLEEVRAAILSRGDLREELSRCVRAELDLVESGSRRLKEAAAARAEKEVRIEETIANFQGGAAAKRVVARLEGEVADLDREIRRLEAEVVAGVADPNNLVDALIGELDDLAGGAHELPAERLREVAHCLLDAAVVNLKTRDVRLSFRLPNWSPAKAPGDEELRPLRLIGSKASGTLDRTQRVPRRPIAEDHRPMLMRKSCRPGRALRPVTYRCRCSFATRRISTTRRQTRRAA